MSQLIITRGLPSSGKTTWAMAWVAEQPDVRVRLNRNDVRRMLFGSVGGLTDPQEKAVTASLQSLATTHLVAGRDVVIDDKNLRPLFVLRWAKVADKARAAFSIQEFKTDIETLVERDARKPNSLKRGAIETLAKKFVRHGDFLPVDYAKEISMIEPYTPNIYLPSALIVDIDGTIAKRGDRSPFAWNMVQHDEPDITIIDLVTRARHQGEALLFVTGRSDECYEATLAWLEEYVGLEQQDQLFMRIGKDGSRDSVMKAALFDTFIRSEYNVRMVFDDRNSVVAMWREMGIPCLQVANGDF